MNRFEKRRLKRNIYKHANAIMYTLIFVMASLITIVAAVYRNDVSYVDESQLAVTVKKDAIEITNGESIRVAATGNVEPSAETTQPETTVENTTEAAETENTNSGVAKIKVTADTLLVRSQPSQDAEILGTLDQNDVLDAVSVSGEWITISFEGQTGYVSADFVETVE